METIRVPLSPIKSQPPATLKPGPKPPPSYFPSGNPSALYSSGDLSTRAGKDGHHTAG